MTTRSTTTKKTLQSFHARDSLWASFTTHAEEMECSVDYLVNEAMRLYASTHGFLVDTGVGDAPAEATPRPVTRPESPTGAPPALPKPLAPTLREKPAAAMTVPLPRPGGARSGTPAAASAGPPTGSVGLPRPGGSAGSAASGPPRRTSVPPPPPPSTRPGDGAVTGSVATDDGRPKLTVIFQGRKMLIAQDQFIIGRGSKTSDLAIKDANVSRKHAAVIFHNGAYYMKDLGSTNGVEYNGKPVDSKRIDEGDVYTVCGYEIHFTYQA
jgi:neural Wiskott-Aldrich syndrome protein